MATSLAPQRTQIASMQSCPFRKFHPAWESHRRAESSHVAEGCSRSPSSCPIRARREPISPEVMLGSSGGPFSGFCSCRATHASSRGTDYRPNGRKASWESTVAAQRAHNLHLKSCDESKFVKVRTERDRTLPMPALMLSALQVNLAGGRLPPPESDGRRYLKIPLNAFPQASWGSLGPDQK